MRLRVVEGAFVLKDQLKEYTDRGLPLEGMNYYDYHVDTYDGAPLKKSLAAEDAQTLMLTPTPTVATVKKAKSKLTQSEPAGPRVSACLICQLQSVKGAESSEAPI